MFKIDAVNMASNDAISILVTSASLTDVFHTVNLNLSAAIPAIDHKPQPIIKSAASAIPLQTRRKLQAISFDLGSALKSVQAKVQTLGNDVDALINAATAAEQFFQNGATLQEATQETVDLYSFNVDNTTHAGPQCQFPIDKLLDTSHGGVGLTGTCQNCYAYIGVTITASINIQQGKLIDASIIMNGTANFQSTFNLTVNATDLDASAHIATLAAGPIQFLLGAVPIRLTSSTPIRLGVSGAATGNFQMSGDMGMSASVNAGFRIANSQTQFINQLDFDHSGSGVQLPSRASLKSSIGSGALRLYILPVPAINFDYLGGPKVGLKTYLEGIVDFEQTAYTDDTHTTTTSNRHCSSGPSVVANAGLDGTVAADVHIGVGGFQIFNHSYPSLATFSLHHAVTPLYCPYGSATSSTSGRRLQQISALGPWAQVGNIWQGEQIYTGAGHSKCDPSAFPPFVLVSLQLVAVVQTGSGPSLDFLATVNSGTTDLSSSGYAQLNQQLYTMDCYDDAMQSASFTAKRDASYYVGASQGGTGAASLQLQSQSGTFDWRGAGLLIALTSSDACVATNLTLVMPQPSQASSSNTEVPKALSDTCPWASTAGITSTSGVTASTASLSGTIGQELLVQSTSFIVLFETDYRHHHRSSPSSIL